MSLNITLYPKKDLSHRSGHWKSGPGTPPTFVYIVREEDEQGAKRVNFRGCELLSIFSSYLSYNYQNWRHIKIVSGFILESGDHGTIYVLQLLGMDESSPAVGILFFSLSRKQVARSEQLYLPTFCKVNVTDH